MYRSPTYQQGSHYSAGLCVPISLWAKLYAVHTDLYVELGVDCQLAEVRIALCYLSQLRIHEPPRRILVDLFG